MKRGRSTIWWFKGLLPLILFCGLSQQAYAFVLISNGGKIARWENGRVNYYLKDIPDEFEAAIEDSFDAWTDISGIDLRFIPKGSIGEVRSRDQKSSLTWVEEGWTSLSFRPPSNALAVTLSSFDSSSGLITDADIYFNDEDFDWAVIESEEDERFVDVQNIATHEIGHMIGLDHSTVNFFETDPELAEATMFYASGSGETSRRVPKTDDIRGVTALYSADPLPAAKVTAVEELERVGRTVLYRISGENFTEYTSFVFASENFSMGDVVARYKTILSSSEAEVEFNFSGFYDLTPQLLVFNGAGSSYSVDWELDASLLGPSSLSANESSGGGGCSSRPGSAMFDLSWMLILALSFLLSSRRRAFEYVEKFRHRAK